MQSPRDDRSAALPATAAGPFGRPILPTRDWPLDAPLIAAETAWRQFPPDAALAPSVLSGPVLVTRWTDSSSGREWVAQAPQNYHTVALALKRTHLALFVNDTLIHDGVVERGMVQISTPISLNRCITRAPSDFMHIYVSRRYVAEYRKNLTDERGIASLTDPLKFTRDSHITRLTTTLVDALCGTSACHRVYADGIALAIVARLLATTLTASRAVPAQKRKAAPLESQPLRQVIEHMDARIDEPITLIELASTIGLSPMHFAARFRAATGSSPLAFLLNRRIERAKELLVKTDSPIVDIAMDVGFSTQAHFTTVFRRVVDETPYRWRAIHARACNERL